MRVFERHKVFVQQLLARLRTSLWLAPTLGVLLAVGGSAGLIRLDRELQLSRNDHTFFFDGGAESARALLSTIASSMLTFTALVFSITILVLQLASNQFSPRVIRTFLEERTTKLALGIFVGTFVYAVAVLAQVRGEPSPFVPAIATWVALVSVLASVGVFIRYIHRMTHGIRAITVIDRISRETREAIERMFPSTVARRAAPSTIPSRGEPDAQINHDGAPGVITFIDADGLVELATQVGCVLELVPKVGGFVPTNAPLLRVWGPSPGPERCRSLIAFDVERTIEQDPAFGFRQLVDIAIRALSPGINDPSTAGQALDHLHDLLRRLLTRQFPSPARAGKDGHVRLIVNAPTLADYVHLALDEIRSYGESSIQIQSKLAHITRDCAALAEPGQRDLFERELRPARHDACCSK